MWGGPSGSRSWASGVSGRVAGHTLLTRLPEGTAVGQGARLLHQDRPPSFFPSLRGPSTALTLRIKAILLRSSWFRCAWQTLPHLVLIPFRLISLFQLSQGYRCPTPNSWGYRLQERSALPQGNYFWIPYWIVSHTCKRHHYQGAGPGYPHILAEGIGFTCYLWPPQVALEVHP